MRVHFISIGGSVMHQLAIALHRKGYKVAGSDDEVFEPSRTNLLNEGLLPKQEGWFATNITPNIDAIILGMHARADNPELIKARALGLPIYSFPAYIYQESKNKKRIVIGGSHGKTTTTAMIMHVLQKTNQSFDYMVGARLNGFDQSVAITNAPLIVCEGDEYPASALEKQPKFHFLFPHISVLTGIAWDHINVFPTYDIYVEQFRIFIQKIESGGYLIYNATDDSLVKLIQHNLRKDIQYIPYTLPTHKIVDGQTELTIEDNTSLLKVFGDHNLLNMHAAYHVCRLLNISAADFVQAIASFTGAAKRLELLYEQGNTHIYRDFAHAPSKVKATIQALRQQFPQQKLVALLELHTYSSLQKDFLPQYTHSLDGADAAAVFYSQHTLTIKQLPNIEEQDIQNGFANTTISILNNADKLTKWINTQKNVPAIYVLMSSGNYDGVDVVEQLKIK